jgi:hypothetical protein
MRRRGAWRALILFGGDDIEPINDLGVMAMGSDEAGDNVPTLAGALAATHTQHRELADQITEGDCAVAGH